MKRTIATALVCALMLSAAGCGAASKDGSSGLNMEPIGQENSGSEASLSNDENAAGSDAGTDGKNGAGSDTGADSKTGAGTDSAAKTEQASSQDAEAKSDATGEDLYEAFKKGEAKVKYRGTGDRTAYLETAAALEVGKSYTMDELAKALESADEYSDLKFSSKVDYSFIDCGKDGVPELLAVAQFGEEFDLIMIIKEIDGELVMCYDQDSWSRSYVEVKDNGIIEGSGSGGAAVHIVDYAYVDAKGDYKFYYGVEETLTMYGDYYAYKTGEDYVIIPSEGLDADHIGIRDYYFEPDYEDRTHYYEYFAIDDNYSEVEADADSDDSSELKQRFTDAGIKTYTKSEMDQMLKDRASEIGYPAG